MTQRSENFTVGPCILSFPHLFQPQAGQGMGTPKYNATIVFDAAVRDQINAQVAAVAQAAFPNGEYNQPGFKWPIHATEEKPARYGDLPGMFFANIKAGADYQPQVVDAQCQPILDPGAIKAGNIVYVALNVYSYNTGGVGVGIGVSAVMKHAEGTPRVEGGAVNVQNAFANVPAAPPAGAQAPGSVPAAPGMQPPPPVAPAAAPALQQGAVAPAAAPALQQGAVAPAAAPAPQQGAPVQPVPPVTPETPMGQQQPSGVAPSFT